MALRPGITTVLFDLDGTLLPMDPDDFIKAYFTELSKKAAPLGYDGKAIVSAVWKATAAMQENDGTMLNIDCFWQAFADILGEKVMELKPHFDRFYTEEFDRVKRVTGENPNARKVVDKLQADGIDLIVATNPLFPLAGNLTRLNWVGLKKEDFSYITAYENSTFCKPNVEYYAEILKKQNKQPSECLMVGNDVVEDLAAAELGLDTYLVTDCLINPNNTDISAFARGSFADFTAYVGA